MGAPLSGRTRLIVWRHGRTEYNASDRIQGQLDVQLDDTGRAQAAAAAPRLAELKPDLVVSSDLRRASETAGVLADLAGVPVRLDARLRERNFGAWQGMLISEVAQKYPAEYGRWRAGQPVDGCGIEELDDMAKRVGAGLEEAAAQVPEGTVVVTGHGSAAKYGVAALLGWSVAQAATLGSLENCHWIELRSHSTHGWRMCRYNIGVSTSS